MNRSKYSSGYKVCVCTTIVILLIICMFFHTMLSYKLRNEIRNINLLLPLANQCVAVLNNTSDLNVLRIYKTPLRRIWYTVFNANGNVILDTIEPCLTDSPCAFTESQEQLYKTAIENKDTINRQNINGELRIFVGSETTDKRLVIVQTTQ